MGVRFQFRTIHRSADSNVASKFDSCIFKIMDIIELIGSRQINPQVLRYISLDFKTNSQRTKTVKNLLCSLLAAMGLLCSPVCSQTLDQMRADLVVKHEASVKALRDSILQLRNLRISSCNLGNAPDCELAALTDIEIVLLDIETKYRRASSSVKSTDLADRFTKVKVAADEARSKVSDLINILK